MRRGQFVPAAALLLAACHAAPQRGEPGVAASPASCGPSAQVARTLSTALANGQPAENTPVGVCLASAAHRGSATAAMQLAQAYQAASTPTATTAALRLDLFGRHIAWLHLAAEQGEPSAQLLLARETDDPPYVAMSDVPLAWYQAAAEKGNAQALEIITDAYAQGRIADTRLYALKRWLSAQGDRAAVYPATLRRLNAPPEHRLP